MPPRISGICGRLTSDLPLGYLQGGSRPLTPPPHTGKRCARGEYRGRRGRIRVRGVYSGRIRVVGAQTKGGTPEISDPSTALVETRFEACHDPLALRVGGGGVRLVNLDLHRSRPQVQIKGIDAVDLLLL